MTKLKPCPFCGNKDLRVFTIFADNGVIVGKAIICEPVDTPCGAHGPIVNGKTLAVKLWNTRKAK